jgi:hypothetical protein
MLGDGHQGVNMGYSTDGFIHMILGAHTATHYYYKITWPDLEIVHSDERELALPSDKISYPQFYNLAGELLLFFRDDDSKTYSLNRYDAVSGAWRPWIVPLITTPDEVDRIYTNGLSISGSTIAIAYTWRYYPDSPNPDEYVVLNEGWRVVWSNDFGFTWQAFDGASLSLPIQAFSPPISNFVPAGRNLSNQAGSWLGPDQVLRVSYFADDAQGVPQVYIAEFDLSTREVVTYPPISNNDTDFDLIGRGTLSLPLSRPVVFGLKDRLVTLYRYNDSLYAGWRPISDVIVDWQGIALCTGFLDNYEPIMDFGRTGVGDISLYIQGAKQGPNDTNFPSDFGAPVTMLDLSYEAVSTLMSISP